MPCSWYFMGLVRGMRKERKNGFHGNGPKGMHVCVGMARRGCVRERGIRTPNKWLIKNRRQPLG